jgi:hypothetical protein
MDESLFLVPAPDTAGQAVDNFCLGVIHVHEVRGLLRERALVERRGVDVRYAVCAVRRRWTTSTCLPTSAPCSPAASSSKRAVAVGPGLWRT